MYNKSFCMDSDLICVFVYYFTYKANVNEPSHEKTNNLDFQPCRIKPKLYICTQSDLQRIYGAKTKALISCAVTVALVSHTCADCWFSDARSVIQTTLLLDTP